MTTVTMQKIKVLMERTNNGMHVELRLVGKDQLQVVVKDDPIDFVLTPVDGVMAIDMFNHPYAYRNQSLSQWED